MQAVEAFLKDIDAAWPSAHAKIRLRIIGSTALMLQTSYERGTKDSDVLETWWSESWCDPINLSSVF